MDSPMLQASPSYCDIVTSKISASLISMVNSHVDEIPADLDDSMVKLLVDDMHLLNAPWKYFVIVKTFGSKFTHQYLNTKLDALWRLAEPLCSIDLGPDFYTVKLQDPESQVKVWQGGPWFIAGSFVSIRKWDPNFVPSNSMIDYTAIWIHLPQLLCHHWTLEAKLSL
ncbi:hypothetical protein P3L10_028633 [Capsicum annuum]